MAKGKISIGAGKKINLPEGNFGVYVDGETIRVQTDINPDAVGTADLCLMSAIRVRAALNWAIKKMIQGKNKHGRAAKA